VRVALDANRLTDLFAATMRWPSAGTPIPDNDLWIAALVVEHNLTLITRDRHFRRIPQLLRR